MDKDKKIVPEPSQKREYFISMLMALLPVAIIMSLLEEITGIGGTLPYVVVFFGSTELIKEIRKRRRKRSSTEGK